MQLSTARPGNTFSLRGYGAAPYPGFIFDNGPRRAIARKTANCFTATYALTPPLALITRSAYAHDISQLHRAMLPEASFHPRRGVTVPLPYLREGPYRNNVGLLEAKIWITLTPREAINMTVCGRLKSLSSRLETLHERPRSSCSNMKKGGWAYDTLMLK